MDEWITVKANVKEDFKRLHDLDVDELDGLAIMSDTDNSKMKSIDFIFELSVSDIIASPSSSSTSKSCNLLKSSLTLALTVIHSSKLFLVLAKTLSIDFFVYGLG